MENKLLLLDKSEVDALETILEKVSPARVMADTNVKFEKATEICANIMTIYMQLTGNLAVESLMCADCHSKNVGFDGKVD